MPGTVRRIIDRIKDQRSSGNSVVALTVETRLVLQGFDPQRYEYDTPDDPGRLARIKEIADEMDVGIADLMAEADAEPDPEAAPAPPPAAHDTGEAQTLSQSAQDAARAAGIGRDAAAAPTREPADIPSDHPLQAFRRIADEALAEATGGAEGARTGASFDVLMKSSLLVGLYSIASDRVFCDLLQYNALFTWFLDLPPAQAAFDPEAFAADREEALASPAGRAFFDRVVPEAARHKLFSGERLQANGRQIKGWMSQRAGA